MYLLGTFCLSAVKCLCVYAQYHAYQIQDTILLGAQFFPVEIQAYVLQEKASIKILFPLPPSLPPTLSTYK